MICRSGKNRGGEIRVVKWLEIKQKKVENESDKYEKIDKQDNNKKSLRKYDWK